MVDDPSLKLSQLSTSSAGVGMMKDSRGVDDNSLQVESLTRSQGLNAIENEIARI